MDIKNDSTPNMPVESSGIEVEDIISFFKPHVPGPDEKENLQKASRHEASNEAEHETVVPLTPRCDLMPTLSAPKHPRAFKDAENLLKILPENFIAQAKKRRPGSHPADSKVSVALLAATLMIEQQQDDKDTYEIENKALNKLLTNKQEEVDHMRAREREMEIDCVRLEQTVEGLLNRLGKTDHCQSLPLSITKLVQQRTHRSDQGENLPTMASVTPKRDVRDSLLFTALSTPWKGRNSSVGNQSSPYSGSSNVQAYAVAGTMAATDHLLVTPSSIEYPSLSNVSSSPPGPWGYVPRHADDIGDRDYIPSSDIESSPFVPVYSQPPFTQPRTTPPRQSPGISDLSDPPSDMDEESEPPKRKRKTFKPSPRTKSDSKPSKSLKLTLKVRRAGTITEPIPEQDPQSQAGVSETPQNLDTITDEMIRSAQFGTRTRNSSRHTSGQTTS